MSGFIEEDESAITEIKQAYERGFHEVLKSWESIYGLNSQSTLDKIAQLKNSVKEFWDFQVEAVEEKKRNLMVSMEQMGKEAVELERALGLENNVMELESDVPLVEMEEALWKLVESYRALKAERLTQYNILRKKEEEMCNLLHEVPKIPTHRSDGLEQATHSSKSPHCYVPTNEDMLGFEKRIEELEGLESELRNKFLNEKLLLRDLLNECGILPFTNIERAACSDDNATSETIFPFSATNLEKLKSSVQLYLKTKEDQKDEAAYLQSSIVKLSKKMLKDQDKLENFLSINSGFSKKTIAKLKEVLENLKEERKMKLKELVLSHRTLLDDLWTRCCYTDQQRAEFRPYYVDYYSEDILDLHELEVEKLESFYNNYKRIFQLAEKHKELWARLLQLEEESSDTKRLFNNRGGRLLLEEKERKTIQKKVPAIKAELVTLLNEYKASTGKDFLLFGSPLLETLEQAELQRQEIKDHQKQMRKAANTENVLLESRLGSQPKVVNKRKILTPQQPNTTFKMMKVTQSSANSSHSTASYKSAVSSTRGQMLQPPALGMMLRSPAAPRVGVGAAAGSYAIHTYTPGRTPVQTPAASTPENGSPSYPSYESFQEHLEKSASKKVPHNSTKKLEPRVLRPRNLNETVSKSSRLTPYKVPKTPVKTPSKIPFRIATGGKIPSIVPPMSPRNNATKLTTPRSKLPIIF